jgi:hypothetical protein
MQRTMQNELHALEMKHQELEMKAKERDRLQQSIADFKGEVSGYLNRVKAREMYPFYLWSYLM